MPTLDSLTNFALHSVSPPEGKNWIREMRNEK